MRRWIRSQFAPAPMRPDQVPIELVRPSFYGMLVCYYCGCLTYGVTQALFVSPSLADAGGDRFAVIWASLVAIASLGAAVGVLATRRLRKSWVELFTTIALFSLLIGYSAALLSRGLSGVTPTASAAIPLAWLPLIISVMPIWRTLVMAQDGLSPKMRARKRARFAREAAKRDA